MPPIAIYVYIYFSKKPLYLKLLLLLLLLFLKIYIVYTCVCYFTNLKRKKKICHFQFLVRDYSSYPFETLSFDLWPWEKFPGKASLNTFIGFSQHKLIKGKSFLSNAPRYNISSAPSIYAVDYVDFQIPCERVFSSIWRVLRET